MKIGKQLIVFLTLIVFSSCKGKYELPPIDDDKEKISNGAYVTGFRNLGSKVFFAIEIPETEWYSLNINYATTEKVDATVSLYINDTIHAQVNMIQSHHETDWQTTSQLVMLKRGVNYIVIQRDVEDNGLFNLNYIEIN